MKWISYIFMFFFVLNCSSVQNEQDEEKYGLFKVTQVECEAPKLIVKSHCEKWKYIQILNPKGKFFVNSDLAIVTWDKDFDHYAAESLRSFKKNIEDKKITYLQKSVHGMTELVIAKNESATYISDYKSHHGNRIFMKAKLTKVHNMNSLNIKYPGTKESSDEN